jgi:hypothetical protein
VSGASGDFGTAATAGRFKINLILIFFFLLVYLNIFNYYLCVSDFLFHFVIHSIATDE